MQKNLKHFNFDTFDGMGDLVKHVNYFTKIVLIYYYNDLTKCRFFAFILKSRAWRWFNGILSRNIQSWKEFMESFLRRFRANKTHELHMFHLKTIYQNYNESLYAYMKRFRKPLTRYPTWRSVKPIAYFVEILI